MSRPGIRTRKAQRDLAYILDPKFRQADIVRVPPRKSLKDQFTAWIRSMCARGMHFGRVR